MMFLIAAGLVVLGIYLSLYVLYQGLLFAANAFVPDAPEFQPRLVRRINVLLPAHNEELFLPRLLSSIETQNYPRARFGVTVIADNCSDGTADAARRFGVDVLERRAEEHRGKGHAIGWALGQLDLGRFDAVVVIDSDSVIDRDFLKYLNLQMDRGDLVVQCHNGIANPGESWFTRLLHVSRTISNDILHPAKTKLGLSSDLMGNGMCFDVSILRSHKWNAFSVAEDWEYYANLVLSGVHIGYCKEARVYHQESVGLQQAASQRMRWSGGRFQMLRRFGGRMFAQGIKTRSLECVDAALPLFLPNPSLGINLTILGIVAAAAHGYVSGKPGLLWWFAVLSVIQFAMFVAGVLRTEDKLASALSLLLAPIFLAWKLVIDIVSLCGFGTKQWKATERRAS